MTRRVVVTGAAGLCPLGRDWPTIREGLQNRRSGVSRAEAWASVRGLKTRLAAAVPDFRRPKHYSRKQVRGMGRVSLLSARAAEGALTQAGLLGDAVLQSGRCGISFGSTSGSPPAIETYAEKVTVDRSLQGITSSEYLRLMSHTTAANLAHFFSVRGRIIPTNSACTSGSQGIGFAYEAVRHGLQDVMIAGGAEELHVICTAVFDILYATSTRNDAPHEQPRPFDRDRDGLVVGEGAAVLVLEAYEHAVARGANILAEVVGFATNCDGAHVVNPNTATMRAVMEGALRDAALEPGEIDYVSAHGTATEVGDIAESTATAGLFGKRPPVSSLKGYMGHTLGACGALEAMAAVYHLHEGWLAGNLNLATVDPRCGDLNYLTETRDFDGRTAMSNNFAFGGVNTSLIFARV
ncbi:beta-ketoacyl-ACP synthase [Acanthopleuribacter pedis]|uniref:Beta-ketoacyl-ACP synthase n=1 Tax=Acanthopleuribacter pedis TaxID=442870 RepID=A0A8J7Q443_9BACT|nr:beta-ketoacyl-ACP synthase [Acanthopleuribacter pedis]